MYNTKFEELAARIENLQELRSTYFVSLLNRNCDTKIIPNDEELKEKLDTDIYIT